MIKLPKATLDLNPGAELRHKDRNVTVTHTLGLDEVLVVDDETKRPSYAKVMDLFPREALHTPQAPDLQIIPDKAWVKAEFRYNAIEPLLKMPGRTRADVAARAAEVGVSVNTLYEWMRTYQRTGRKTVFLPAPRSDRKKSRLAPEVEAIVQAAIESEYLTTQRKTAEDVWKEVKLRCRNASLRRPGLSTIQRRITDINQEKKVRSREGKEAADKKHRQLRGSFPGADWPLAVIQIDHTYVDLILLDDIYRQPIGRPWITIAIDVNSRVVLGFYISFDPPGALGTGLCLAHAILPKEAWLISRKIPGEWPCWGIPNKIHADNAKEFRGEMLTRACDDYGIDLEWRPVGKPRYGSHIERLIGTSMNQVHTLPGTTQSNVIKKMQYDSEGKAIMTLSEFEAWYGDYVVNEYHLKKHSSLGIPPIEMFRKGILGDGKTPGTGLPPRIADEQRLRLDLMPFKQRTIQNYGVLIDGIHYNHDVLRGWIDSKEPGSKAKREFTFRRDPRDISTVWFFDPEINRYFEIPYRNTTHPPISIWELRAVKKQLADEDKEYDNEDEIFAAYERRRQMEREAEGKTAAVRRAEQRRKLVPGTTIPKDTTRSEPSTSLVPNTAHEDIQPFDDLDFLP